MELVYHSSKPLTGSTLYNETLWRIIPQLNNYYSFGRKKTIIQEANNTNTTRKDNERTDTAITAPTTSDLCWDSVWYCFFNHNNNNVTSYDQSKNFATSIPLKKMMGSNQSISQRTNMYQKGKRVCKIPVRVLRQNFLDFKSSWRKSKFSESAFKQLF